MALIGKVVLYVTFALPVIGILAGLIALIGAAIYNDKKLRVQGLVGVLGICCLVTIAFSVGIMTATVMAAGASGR